MVRNRTLDVSIEEHMGLTRAKARLRWREKSEVGIGTARLNPADRDIAEIGGIPVVKRNKDGEPT